MSTPEEITAVAMLCDYAQIADGKLNIMGGGWGYLWATEEPAEWGLILAVNLSVPWAKTNQDIVVTTRLYTEDHEAVVNAEGEEIFAEGNLRVGRPPDARPGIPIIVPFFLPFAGLSLNFGGYVWEISAGTNVITRVPFQVAQRRS